ncbi:isochorismate synthase MenF [Entomohabitans teleogrylli]|uniref:isochorismate synthase MenF n=1 Tax=Entomohabitans teleogrylli TaxID=1384589 RepID=UPI00073D97F2|nr:isochorismate synthase MenF [Entomohabitans teleogrylli]
MNAVDAALHHLLQALEQPPADSAALYTLSVPVSLCDGVDPLAWLAAQAMWPQFYWQQRDGDEELAALGAVTRFDSLPAAQDFLRHSPGAQQSRICGLNAFDPARGALFLPRLLWLRQGDSATLTLTLKPGEQAACRALLGALRPAQPLPALRRDIRQENHFPGEAAWCELVQLATRTIAGGALDKVVLARASDLQFSRPVDAAALMAASRQVNLRCYHFYMAFDAREAFLGSSPERLWRRIGDELRTEALAGTVVGDDDDRRAQQLAQWLLQDDKNQRENMLVVEDICQRLQGNVASLEVLPARVLRLRKVQHLRRCIWTRLAEPDDALCLHLLQPTAAVAGLPRDVARRFIAAHEPFGRQWYAGSAGYLSGPRSEFCVALRSAQVSQHHVRLYAGAGIVSGSDAQQEWQEINNKAAGLRSLLVP